MTYCFPEEGEPFEADHLALSDSHGIYIPRMFCSAYPQENCSDWAWNTCLKGPDQELILIDPALSFSQKFFNAWRDSIKYGYGWDWGCPANLTTKWQINEEYWDAWADILDTWKSSDTDKDGNTIIYELYQDGDLWVTKQVGE
jgi:hypothetical protein